MKWGIELKRLLEIVITRLGMSRHARASGIEDNAAANRDAQESAGEHNSFQLAQVGVWDAFNSCAGLVEVGVDAQRNHSAIDLG